MKIKIIKNVLKSKFSKPKFKKDLYVFLLTIVGVFGDADASQAISFLLACEA